MSHPRISLRRYMVIGTLLMTATAWADSAEDLIRKGNAAFAQEKLDDAFDAYSRAGLKNSKLAEAVFNKAVVHAKKGKLKKARDGFEKALNMANTPGLKANARFNLGNCALELTDAPPEMTGDGKPPKPENPMKVLEKTLERFKGADRHFRKALRNDPTFADAAHNMELTRRRIRATEKEIEKLKEEREKQQQQQQNQLQDAIDKQEKLNEDTKKAEDQKAENQKTEDQKKKDQKKDSEELSKRQKELEKETEKMQNQRQQQQKQDKADDQEKKPSDQLKQRQKQTDQHLESAMNEQKKASEQLKDQKMDDAKKSQEKALDELRKAHESQKREQRQKQDDRDKQEQKEKDENQGEKESQEQNEQQDKKDTDKPDDAQTQRKDAQMEEAMDIIQDEKDKRKARRIGIIKRKPVQKDW